MNIFKNQYFVVANMKQFGDSKSITSWSQSFITEINKIELKINIVICPSFVYLEFLKREFQKISPHNQNRVFIGSQNISAFSNLENTGEVSGQSLKELVTFSLIGHSERKENFDLVTKKHENCLENEIVPIVCFYENKEVFELENCLYAYEDPKSISREGIFKEKSYDDLVGVVKELETFFDSKPVLYGGSVTSKNVNLIKDLNFFKGVLVGRSSLDPIEFTEIIRVLN
jgi:triosephosphate isomerase